MNAKELCIHELYSQTNRTSQNGLSIFLGPDTPIWRQPKCPHHHDKHLPSVSDLVQLATKEPDNNNSWEYLEFWTQELPDLVQEFCTGQEKEEEEEEEHPDRLMSASDSIQLLTRLLLLLCTSTTSSVVLFLDNEQEISTVLDSGYLSICRLIQHRCTDTGVWLQILDMVGSIVACVRPTEGLLIESTTPLVDVLVSQITHLDFHVQSAAVAFIYGYALWDSETRSEDPIIRLINQCACAANASRHAVHLKREVGGMVLSLLDRDLLRVNRNRDTRNTVERLSQDINPSVRSVWQEISNMLDATAGGPTEITPFANLVDSLREHVCLKNIADVAGLFEFISAADAKLVVGAILEPHKSDDRLLEIMTAIYFSLPVRLSGSDSDSVTLYEMASTVIAIACHKIYYYHQDDPLYGRAVEYLETTAAKDCVRDWAMELVGFHFQKHQFLLSNSALLPMDDASNCLPVSLFVQQSSSVDQVIRDLEQLSLQHPIPYQPKVDLGRFDNMMEVSGDRDPWSLRLPSDGEDQDRVLTTSFDIQQPKLDQTSAKDWWSSYVSSRISQSILTSTDAAVPSQLLVESILESVSMNDRMELYFAQPTTDLQRIFSLDSVLSTNGPSLDRMDAMGVDRTKAHEALLYYYMGSGGTGTENRTELDLSQLYGYLLAEGTGRTRFTSKGTFDVASIFISDLADHPSSSHGLLDTLALTNRAIDQLSPYLPQLLSMLTSPGPSPSPNPQGVVNQSAPLAILVEFAKHAPQLVVLYLAVALRASRGRKLLAYVVSRLEDQSQVEEVGAFVGLLNSLKALPQERLRAQCLKAQNAISDGMEVGRSLKACLRVLEEGIAWPESPATADYLATAPQLRLLFEQLAACKAPGRERVWSQIFRLLDAAPLSTLAYCAPGLLQLPLAIPLPRLTAPAAPLVVEGLEDCVRVIGSKTRPKLLTLRLSHSSHSTIRYILKGSEDLGADESVIQAFQRLNRLAQGRSLSLYNVVPVDSDGGLIEVVDGMASLHYIRVSKRQEDSAPADDLLYRQLLGSALSAQHLHLALRNMARSIAASSAMGYLLGVGDRHLNNLLADPRMGRMMQIDFNVSFDIGSISRVPETVPFRMTPILQYLCSRHTFMKTAHRVLLLMRMDRQPLVRALLSKLRYQPVAEWRRTADAWAGEAERVCDHQTTLREIRASGICPVGGFVPEHPTAERIAQCAVDRVMARLEFRHRGSEADVVWEHARAIWDAATDTDNLSKMFIGWASWI